MGTVRRRKHWEQSGRITEKAIAAFRSGNRKALHRALRLPPWQVSPLDADSASPYPGSAAGGSTWADSAALREQLENA